MSKWIAQNKLIRPIPWRYFSSKFSYTWSYLMFRQYYYPPTSIKAHRARRDFWKMLTMGGEMG